MLLVSSEIAAWLAENGPVSVALNAFAMQVSIFVTASWRCNIHDWSWSPRLVSRPLFESLGLISESTTFLLNLVSLWILFQCLSRPHYPDTLIQQITWCLHKKIVLVGLLNIEKKLRWWSWFQILVFVCVFYGIVNLSDQFEKCLHVPTFIASVSPSGVGL